MPNPNSGFVNSDNHLQCFRFIGKIIAKANIEKILFPCRFTVPVYKYLFGKPVEFHDLIGVDDTLYRSLSWMAENDISEQMPGTSFVASLDRFGKSEDVELIPGGADIEVTEANKAEFIKLTYQYRLITSVKEQLDALKAGFHALFPSEPFHMINPSELEELISGSEILDVEDWRRNTEYFDGYNASSKQIIWFWDVLKSLDPAQLRGLLKFTTGTVSVPIEGFSGLRSSGVISKFKIKKFVGAIDRLPISHTCYNQLDLPEYQTRAILEEKLLKAISYAVGFYNP
jgi:E3 ubiquitin-protein ligase HUWE1